MLIVLEKISHKYNYECLFKDIDFSFQENIPVVILGSNGSGKTTLLKIISSQMYPSSGSICYSHQEQNIPIEFIYKHITYSGPYLELIEEFTLMEMLNFHNRFRKFKNNMTVKEILDITTLSNYKNKALKYFSSGMKQKLRLALAILSESNILLLDEPLANLDKNGIIWYKDMMKMFSQNRVVIVCSNSQDEEYEFCQKSIVIDNFKPKATLRVFK